MRDPLHWMPIKYKLTLTFVLICFVSLVLGGAVSYYTAKKSLYTQILHNLALTTQVHVENVCAYLDSLKRRTEDFSSDGFIRDMTRRIQEYGSDDLRRELSRHLLRNKISIVPDFFETLVVGKDGFVLASSTPANIGLDLSGEVFVQEGRKGIYVGDIHLQRIGTSRSSMEIATPLTDKETHHFIGVIINRIDPRYLSRVVRGGYPSGVRDATKLETWGGSRDCYLVDEKGMLLSATRFLDFDDAFLKKETWTIEPSSDRVGHLVRPGVHTSYGGREVIAALAAVQGTPWRLVSEIETQEVFQPVAILRQRLILIALILATMTAILLLFPTKFMINPILHLHDAAQRIEEGNFGVTVNIDSKDEIGQLAHAFNRMSAALRERAQKIEKYTAELEERENEVRYEKDLLNALIQCMSDGVIFVDANGKIALHNAAAEAIHSVSTYLGKPITACHPAEIHSDVIERIKYLKNKKDAEYHRIIQGSDRFCESTFTPVHDAAGEYLGVVLVSRDITERKHMEERLRHQEKMTVIGQLSAGIAHELNTPLASIAMFSQMLVEECPSDSPFREYAEVIMRNTQACKKITQGLLDYAAQSPTQRREFDLNACVKEAITLCRPLLDMSNIGDRLDLDTYLPHYVGDEEQMRQVFINLAMNAIQAMPKGGVLDIHTGQIIEIGRREIVVEFTDTGNGISLEHRDKIFEPFFTTKPKGIGTGLGLSVSRKIVEAHGGRLDLLVRPNEGGHFIITLPINQEVESGEIDIP